MPKAQGFKRWGVYRHVDGETHIAPVGEVHCAYELCLCDPVIRVGRDTLEDLPFFFVIHKSSDDNK